MSEIKEKKFLDEEGLKVLWNQVNLKDYPNNETLIAVLDAIDQTKADKEELNEVAYISEDNEVVVDPDVINDIVVDDTLSTTSTNPVQNKVVTREINQLSGAIADKVSKTGITLERHTDGLIYIFVDGKPVGNGVELGTIVEGDVIGTLDENNDLLLSGDIADGTYSLKWLKDDGTYADAGNLIVSSVTKYAINTTLSNCSASGATTINGGGSATVTITASSGYVLPDSITVSGASYTWDKASGRIVLSNPTSDVQITVTATKMNLAEPNTTNTTDTSIWCMNYQVGNGGTIEASTSDRQLTNKIYCTTGDTIRIKNWTMHRCGLYKADDSAIAGASLSGLQTNAYITLVSSDTTSATFTIKSSGNFAPAYIRFSGTPSATADDVIITVNQEI